MRGYAAIGLDNPKNHYNVGGAMRAAHCYGAAMIAISGMRYKPASTDTTRAHRHIPLLRVDNVFDALPYDCVPVAVDLIEGATDLRTYIHPERAFYIFGAEDATLGKQVLDRCRDVVFVPTNFCMNLSAAINVVLYDRTAKGRTD